MKKSIAFFLRFDLEKEAKDFVALVQFYTSWTKKVNGNTYKI